MHDENLLFIGFPTIFGHKSKQRFEVLLFNVRCQARLYYDPNTTYFFTLDYKKCLSQHFRGSLTFRCIQGWSPVFKLEMLRYFMYDSELQLLCLVDSQVREISCVKKY